MAELSALGIKVTSDGIVKTTGELERFAKASNAARAAAKPINARIVAAGLSKAMSDIQKLQKAMSSLQSSSLKADSAMRASNLAKEKASQTSTRHAAALDKEAAAQKRISDMVTRSLAAQKAALRPAPGWANGGNPFQAQATALAAYNARMRESQAEVRQTQAVTVSSMTRIRNAVINAYDASRDAVNHWVSALRRSRTATAGVAPEMGGARGGGTFNVQANPANIAAQFQDIGVTAAMGMNPMMIALQQGTQLSSALAGGIGNLGKAIAQVLSPTSLLTIALVALSVVGLQNVDWIKLAQSALNGLADVMVDIAPYAVGMAGALALVYSPAIIGGIAALTKGFVGLAASMLACIPIPVLIVAGLTAIIAAANYFRDDLTQILGFDIVQAAKDGINFIIGGFVGAYNTIIQVWRKLPSALGDAAYQAANRVKRELNELFKVTNTETGKSVSLFNFDTSNPYEGALEQVGAVARETIVAAQSVDYVGDAVGKVNSLAAAGASKLREWAKSLGASDKDGIGRGASSADRLADILRNAQEEIDAQKRRAEAGGLSAQAAAENEKRQELLNRVTEAGIPLTKGLREEIDRLAKSFAEAKIAADVAEAIQSMNENIDKQKRAIADDVAAIGVYGDALIKLRKEQELLNAARDALPRGAALPEGEEERIRGEAADIAGRMSLAEIQKRDEALRKSAESAKYAMDLEREGLYLTGKEAIAHSYAMDRLNAEYERAGFVSAEYAAAVRREADVFAEQRYAIDRTREAIEESREITKGFFTDWINQVREGGNIFKAFANSVINSLNRILDKLLDNMWQNAFAGQSGGGFLGFLGGILGGVKPNALGGVYANDNEVMRFAKGGAFTNSIVSQPTLFKYANGGAFGEMGEAGPEAIMPLKRGPDGSLGVEAHGGRSVNNNVTVENTYNIGGVMTPEAIIAAIRQGGEETMRAVQRQLPTIMNEYDRNGAVAA